MDDTAYISQILSGSAPEAIQHSGRGRCGGSQGRSRQQKRSIRERQNRDTPLDPATSNHLNQPSTKSTQRLFHCGACDVWVPSGRSGNWEIHIAGIRHQRELLSLREHGERGRFIVSIFESQPRSPPFPRPQQRMPGDKTLKYEARVTEQDCENLAVMRTAYLAQVLNMYGPRSAYHTACTLFTPRSLQAALAELRKDISSAIKESKNASPYRRWTWSTLPVGAENMSIAAPVKEDEFVNMLQRLVVSPLALPKSCTPEDLTIRLDILPQFDVFSLPHEFALRMAAVLCILTSSLVTDTPTVIRSLCIATPIAFPTSVSQQAACHGWHHVAKALRDTISRVGLCQLLISRQGRVRDGEGNASNPNGNGDLTFLSEVMEWNSAARDASVAWSVATRATLLLGYHERVGRCSALSLLPKEVLKRIMDRAAPLQGVTQVLETTRFC